MPCDHVHRKNVPHYPYGLTRKYSFWLRLFYQEKISSLNKSIQKHNNLMDCQPYVKHRFRQKSERCFCISSGHRDQKGPAHFPASSTEALLDVSPVAAPPIAQPGQPVKGKAAAARRCSAPLTGSPGCATSQGATGDISSRAAPLSQDWERGGGKRVDRSPANQSIQSKSERRLSK